LIYYKIYKKIIKLNYIFNKKYLNLYFIYKKIIYFRFF